MSANTADFSGVVSEFMSELGGPATFVVTGTELVADDTTGDYYYPTTEITVRAILLDLTLQSNGLQIKPGTLIQSGDKRAFVEPANKFDSASAMPVINPASDKFVMGGITYTILTLKETDPSASDNILLELYLRK